VQSIIQIPVERVVNDGPIIYSVLILVIILLIASIFALYWYLRQERDYWRNIAQDLQQKLLDFLN
jgi:hypothetical protein